jgi:hypothetical protein
MQKKDLTQQQASEDIKEKCTTFSPLEGDDEKERFSKLFFD